MSNTDNKFQCRIWYSEDAMLWHWVFDMDGNHYSGNAETEEKAKKDVEATINWIKENQ